MHQFINTRRYGLALDEIARTPAHRTIGITNQKRADMLALADRMKLKDDLVPGAAAEAAAGSRSRSPGMARMVAPGADIDRVIQRGLSPARP